MKLYLTDLADPSVGMSQRTWEIDCPFDVIEPYPEDIELGDWFKEQMINIYKEFADGKLLAEYDFELENLSDPLN
jgi:hypothetical protein